MALVICAPPCGASTRCPELAQPCSSIRSLVERSARRPQEQRLLWLFVPMSLAFLMWMLGQLRARSVTTLHTRFYNTMRIRKATAVFTVYASTTTQTEGAIRFCAYLTETGETPIGARLVSAYDQYICSPVYTMAREKLRTTKPIKLMLTWDYDKWFDKHAKHENAEDFLLAKDVSLPANTHASMENLCDFRLLVENAEDDQAASSGFTYDVEVIYEVEMSDSLVHSVPADEVQGGDEGLGFVAAAVA